MKTLIVDDNFICRAKMMAIMESFGECSMAEDATAAIAFFNESVNMGAPFDLVTLDIAMPGMDGKELLQVIRQIQERSGCDQEPKVKIIMVTSHPDRENLLASFRAGCDDFIVKPISMEIMVQKLVKLGVIGGPSFEPVPGEDAGEKSGASPSDASEKETSLREILIVDDDFASRIKMKVIMEHFGTCTLVEGGSEGISCFREALVQGNPYEYVTLDIAMPVMDGKEALKRMREMESQFKVPKEKRARIMMVTCHSEMDNIVACLNAGCDEYILKPFTMQTVGQKMECLENRVEVKEETPAGGSRKTVSRMIGDVYRALHGKEMDLPMLPEINRKLGELIRKGAGIKEMAELLKNDVYIGSHLLRTANSAWYRGTEKITTLEDALTRLGISEIKQQVDLLGNRNLYDSIGKRYARIVDELWSHSLACANAAVVAATMLDMTLETDPFLLGLTHDIGKLVLLSIVDKKEKTGAWDRDVEGESIYHLLSEYHPRFGATLLERWKFPKTYITTVLYQEKPDEAESLTKELTIINFSNALAESLEKDSLLKDPEELSFLKSAILMGLTPEIIAQIREEVARRVEALKAIFGNLRYDT